MPRWLALAFCGVGAVLLGMAVRQSSRGRETRHWTRTPGRVVESRVALLGEADEQRPRRWGFVIRYAYEARGRALESRQVWIGSEAAADWTDEATARGWVERFPQGGEVTVWVDPADPRRAVLVPGVPGLQLAVLVAAGLASLGLGLFVLARGAGR